MLGDRDLDGFIKQTLISIGVISAVAAVKSAKQYIANLLGLTWRQLLTRAIHRFYYTGIRYYRLNVLDSTVDNP